MTTINMTLTTTDSKLKLENEVNCIILNS